MCECPLEGHSPVQSELPRHILFLSGYNYPVMLPYSIFEGDRLLGSGSKADVALFAKRAEGKTTFIFDNATGKTIDFDLRGTERQVLARLSPAPLPGENESAIVETLRGRGRPNQGVIGREVTLLPRHWEWLAEQPGGASAALRRLVEAARSDKTGRDARRKSRERLHIHSGDVGPRLAQRTHGRPT